MDFWYFLTLACIGGIGIGLFYFGGLWWTVQRLPEFQRPAVWILGSFLVRTVVSLGGFYLIMGGQWQRLLAALVGFMAARLVLVKRLKTVPTGSGPQN